MTLEVLIAALSIEIGKRGDGYVVPKGFNNPHSYRGFYERVAFTPTGPTTLGAMLASARGAIGSTYCGWKGGDFRMDEKSLVHVAARGRTDDFEDYDGLTEERLAALICATSAPAVGAHVWGLVKSSPMPEIGEGAALQTDQCRRCDTMRTRLTMKYEGGVADGKFIYIDLKTGPLQTSEEPSCKPGEAP